MNEFDLVKPTLMEIVNLGVKTLDHFGNSKTPVLHLRVNDKPLPIAILPYDNMSISVWPHPTMLKMYLESNGLFDENNGYELIRVDSRNTFKFAKREVEGKYKLLSAGFLHMFHDKKVCTGYYGGSYEYKIPCSGEQHELFMQELELNGWKREMPDYKPAIRPPQKRGL